MDHDEGRCQSKVMKIVIDRLNKLEEKNEERIKQFVTKDEMQAELKLKSSVYNYANLYQEINDFRLGLMPLIEKKHTLERFISQINK